MGNDSIYYYTSEKVLNNWFDNEVIWATRSITSNDNKDTHHIIECDDNEVADAGIDPEYWDSIKKQMELCKSISLKMLKDIIFDYNIKHSQKFISLAIESYEFASRQEYIHEDGYKIPKANILNNNYTYQLLHKIIKSLNIEQKKQLFNVDFEVSDNLIELIIGSYFPFVICFTYEYGRCQVS
ncbi:hypothetical protein J1C67_09280 [Clostridium gasigenes]|uniref:hypothetical protein n=1 Tax=Clostridium gasigenes TaxID=94869 RepID=UPI001438591C|nr:hypothetical protein [Clostridium gasigenes]NKF08895.1 hypothetical protein [Clostridium gasigenes]QSW21266.1 hypothetical protein J1C67_09280 [Clostridium gasigenes]